MINATTHLAGPDCPFPPDMSQGYVWGVFADYDIVRLELAIGELVRLTDTPGYDGGPFFSPDGTRICYRSHHPAPGPDLDGFPMWAPDGETFVFGSNRHHSGPGDTNLWVTTWVE